MKKEMKNEMTDRVNPTDVKDEWRRRRDFGVLLVLFCFTSRGSHNRCTITVEIRDRILAVLSIRRSAISIFLPLPRLEITMRCND